MFTKEEIKELFAETDKRINRIAERQEKTEESINRFDERMDRFDERMDRLAESQEKTDKQIAKTSREIYELKESQKKTDEQLARTEKIIDKLGAKMDKMNEMYGGLGNNVGQATEELFFNTLTDNPVLKQIRFDLPQRNWHNVVGKCEDEYDIVMKNDDLFIFILEVKFKASPSDVEKLLTTKQENFNILFPEYKDYDQHWGLAATIIDEELKNMAVENGLTILRHKGGIIQYNPPLQSQLIGA